MPRRKKPFTHEDVKAPEDLNRLDKQQRIIFLLSHRQDKIELWNAWRMGPSTESSEIELTRAQMDHANIEGAYLFGAHLEGAFLHFAHLKEANLSNAHLERSFMDEADLTGANLSGAYLQNAILRHTRLQKANLQGAHLNEANLQGAHLEEAHLPTAHLKRAVLHKANLTKANLSAARLQGAHLVGAQLEGANLSNAMLQGAYLNEAQAAKAILMGAFFKWSVLSAANFKGADLCYAQLEGAAIDNASFEQADLRLAHLRETALSSLAPGGLQGVRLYQTYFWGVLSLRYEQFLKDENPNGKSTIWEHTGGRFSEAKDIYKTLKGYFEDAGDYEGANWAYVCEQQMEKLMYAPRWIGWLVYPDWRSKFADKTHYEEYCRPHIGKWAWQVFAEGTSNYGTNWLLPPVWLVAVIVGFALIYWLFGMTTDIPGCEYPNPRTSDCHPGDFLDALVFSVSAMTTVDSGTVQPYLSNVSLTASVEALLGIALTGLFGFVLGNKLRNS